MSPAELKTEIFKLIDQLPENKLSEIFDYLKNLQHNDEQGLELAKCIHSLIEKEKELLQKIAK